VLQRRLLRRAEFQRSGRVDDQVYNRILWLMLEGDVPQPLVRYRALLHALEASR
jgi:hypothetical protein